MGVVVSIGFNPDSLIKRNLPLEEQLHFIRELEICKSFLYDLIKPSVFHSS
jgi:hypothetical protein